MFDQYTMRVGNQSGVGPKVIWQLTTTAAHRISPRKNPIRTVTWAGISALPKRAITTRPHSIVETPPTLATIGVHETG
jgi:hypothetical protein